MIDEVRTGNDAVDAVLESLEGLEELPLEEQVAVFESAHEQLRSALDGPREP